MESGSSITKDQVVQLARGAGLEVSDDRAEAIAARLGVVMEDLELIPEEAIADVEPLPIFEATQETDRG